MFIIVIIIIIIVIIIIITISLFLFETDAANIYTQRNAIQRMSMSIRGRLGSLDTVSSVSLTPFMILPQVGSSSDLSDFERMTIGSWPGMRSICLLKCVHSVESLRHCF